MNEKIYERPEEVKETANETFEEVQFPEEEPYPKKVLPKWLYDLLCFFARFFLPACGAGYGALAAIWGLPYGEAVVSTISVLVIFLSTVLAIDAKTYFEGVKG